MSASAFASASASSAALMNESNTHEADARQ